MNISITAKTGVWLYRFFKLINCLFMLMCIMNIWLAGNAMWNDLPLESNLFWTIIPIWAICAGLEQNEVNTRKIKEIKHRMANPIKDMKK